MLCSTLPHQTPGQWSSDFSRIAQQVLGPVTYTATVKVDLGDFVGDTTGIPVAVEITGTDNQTRVLNTVLDNASSFSIPGLLPDMYSVAIKPSHWLRYVVSAVPMPAEDTSFDIKAATGFTFINGDCDGDNEVTSTDLSVIIDAMDSMPGNANWDATADLDGDGEITSTDLSVVIDNMDKLGD
jgi:hypothetical protein